MGKANRMVVQVATDSISHPAVRHPLVGHVGKTLAALSRRLSRYFSNAGDLPWATAFLALITFSQARGQRDAGRTIAADGQDFTATV